MSELTSFTEPLVRLLTGCTALRHLELVDFNFEEMPHEICNPPQWRLRHLRLVPSQYGLGAEDLGWFVGASADTLESLTLSGSWLVDDTAPAIARLAPCLKAVKFKYEPDWSVDMVPLFAVAEQASVRSVKVSLDHRHMSWEQGRWELDKMRAAVGLAQLPEASRAKATLAITEQPAGFGWLNEAGLGRVDPDDEGDW